MEVQKAPLKVLEYPEKDWFESHDKVGYLNGTGVYSKEAIWKAAATIVHQYPRGILARQVWRLFPDAPYCGVSCALSPLGVSVMTDLVERPERGLFMMPGMYDVEWAEPHALIESGARGALTRGPNATPPPVPSRTQRAVKARGRVLH